MKCPACNSKSTRVLDSRPFKEHKVVRRRRFCTSCQHKFITEENLLLDVPAIVKKDGRREPFSSKKLKSGIQAACQKRPISQSQIDTLVSKIKQRIIEKGSTEIPSDMIGKYVMADLRKLDEVAYVRFASVYMTFKEVNEFFESLGSELIK